MSHLEEELKHIKTDVNSMCMLVQAQLEKCYQSLINTDVDIAHEVMANEKRVNAYELKIDNDCENAFALYNPVAIDLRFLLAVLKINYNLERIGDIAESISRFVVDVKKPFEKELLQTARIDLMFQTSISLMADVTKAFAEEDTALARTVFKKDRILDEVNENASYVIADYIKTHPDELRRSLHVLSMIRKIERVGDQVKNIAEEIIFYIEAKVLKHGTNLSSGK